MKTFAVILLAIACALIGGSITAMLLEAEDITWIPIFFVGLAVTPVALYLNRKYT